MIRTGAALAVLAALVSIPSGAAKAADLDRLLSASGASVDVTGGFGANAIARSFKGGVEGQFGKAAADALASIEGGAIADAEFALLDALEAVSAPVGIESIIGRDGRRRVHDTSKFPYRAVVLVKLDIGRCSGFMIGPDTVVTAGHCVSPGDNFGFYRVNSFRIFPGADGRSNPYGSCRAVDLFAAAGWVVRGRDDYDYGIIKLDCTIGNTTGWFGYYWVAGNNALKGLRVSVTGYPGDKPLTMWKSNGKVTVSQKRRTFYRNDTTGGVSGSPVYRRLKGCGWCVVAVHGYGVYNGLPFSDNNHGARITRQVFANLSAVKDAP